jgi:hypothetical protein
VRLTDEAANQLENAYKQGRELLADVQIKASEFNEGVLAPLQKKLASENPARFGTEVQQALDELKQFGRNGVNANYLESFRQDLGRLPSKFAEPIREAVDDLFEKSASIPDQFRLPYAVKKRSEALDKALTAAGDSIQAQRRAVNTFVARTKGLNEAEKKTLLTAAKQSTPGALVDMVGRALNRTMIGGLVGEPIRTAVAAAGRGRINAAREAVYTGGGRLAAAMQQLDKLQAAGVPAANVAVVQRAMQSKRPELAAPVLDKLVKEATPEAKPAIQQAAQEIKATLGQLKQQAGATAQKAVKPVPAAGE